MHDYKNVLLYRYKLHRKHNVLYHIKQETKQTNLVALFTLTFFICRLPSSCRDMRASFPRRLSPSFSQLTEGMGSPEAWHLNSATLSTPSVWLDGPWRMMGGGLSVSTAGKKRQATM